MADRTTNAELRREKIRLRRAMSGEERMRKSAAIVRALLNCAAYQKADSLLVYVSYREEVSTQELIESALAHGKRVFCPKVEAGNMEFYRIFSQEDLKAGFRGILEPGEGLPAYERKKGGALLVAPGTAFDRLGHRIGYGGGYYDRYLGKFAKPDKPYCIGLCFACQLAERIEPEAHDISMDEVIFA